MAKDRIVSVVVTLAGAAIVAALFVFNQKAYLYNQYIVGNLIGLFWIPMLTILFLFREEPDKWGFNLGSNKKVWAAVGISFAGLLVLMVIASKWTAYQNYYPIFRMYPEFSAAFARYPAVTPWESAPLLMLYAELSYGMYMFCWEFFFRGYLLLGLFRSIKWWAIIPQAVAFGLLHYGKPATEIIASFGAGAILGIMAIYARSFVPGFVLHWAAALTFDFLVVAARPHN